jgi:hypothetical protein
LDGGEVRTTTTLGIEAVATRSNWKKTKGEEKLEQKLEEKVNLVDSIVGYIN